MPGICLPERRDEMDAYREWRVRQDELNEENQMATKAVELNNPVSCFNKAAENEPLFVLRAQDKFAAELVDRWASILEAEGGNPEKVAEARKLAAAMRDWPNQKTPD